MTSGDACPTCVPMEQKERLYEIPNPNKSEERQKLGSAKIYLFRIINLLGFF